GLALQRGLEPVWKGKAQVLAVQRHLVDARALEPGREPAADGFNLGQLRHGGPQPLPAFSRGIEAWLWVCSARIEGRAMSAAGETTHFGDRTVPLEDKQDLVNAVFHGVADRYDLMNDLMSGGVHRLWKDAMVARLAPPKTGSRPYRVLDVAGGTGDIAERIVNASVGYAEVTVADINSDMLRVGEERAKRWRFPSQVKFVEANAEELPFEDESFDAYTIAFGIRNVPRIEKALSEAHRVLKRGGRFLCLEF